MTQFIFGAVGSERFSAFRLGLRLVAAAANPAPLCYDSAMDTGKTNNDAPTTATIFAMTFFSRRERRIQSPIFIGRVA